MSFEHHFTDDGGRQIVWGRTSADYAEHRPNYPAEFYQRLTDRGIGLAGQPILDLGTGVGFLAQQFALQGANVVGIDIDAGQLAIARRAGAKPPASRSTIASPRPKIPASPHASFDAVTASQCWLYFDQERASREVMRLLRPAGRLVTCHFCWLPREDEIARRSEALVLKFNPNWTGGRLPRRRSSANIQSCEPYFDVDDFFVFDAEIPFTRESWRGRFRACRGVGASLSPEEVAAFDREHAELLAATRAADVHRPSTASTATSSGQRRMIDLRAGTGTTFGMALCPRPRLSSQPHTLALDATSRIDFNDVLSSSQATQALGQLFCQPRGGSPWADQTQEVSTEEIARRAYELWEARGRPAGDGSEDWDAAVAELTSRRNGTAACGIGGSGCGARSSAATADARPLRLLVLFVRTCEQGEFALSALASRPFSARCEPPARAI